jgi:folate-binding protein YgfZ
MDGMTTVFREATERAVLVATGKDRVTWLNGLVTCELAKAKPGDGVYGLSVGKTGKILADVLFLLEEARVVLVVPRDTRESLRAALDHYLVMEDVELSPDEATVLLVRGSSAREALAAARAAGASGAMVEDAAVVTAGDAAAAAGAMERAGAARVADDAWEAARVERGEPRFGVDFDGATYPQEASLEKRAVSFCKGCYLGQEVVCMLEMRGHVKRKLVSLAVEGDAPPSRGAKVTDDAGQEIGEVTSAAIGPSSQKPVALAMVKAAFAAEGKAVRVGDRAAAVVHA